VSAVVAPAHGAGAPVGSARNVLVMSAAVFLLIAGEQLWSRFLPVYLVTLGAPAVALGLWGSSKDFLDAALQYPGGAVHHHRSAARDAALEHQAVARHGLERHGCGVRHRAASEVSPTPRRRGECRAVRTTCPQRAVRLLVRQDLPPAQDLRGSCSKNGCVR